MRDYAKAGLTLRPYQVVDVVCALGAGVVPPEIQAILDAVRADPDVPVTLRCNAGDAFYYQDPGTAEDTPEGLEFNRLRDLEILHKLNLFPGATLPARIVFTRLLVLVESLESICVYPEATSEAWRGCPTEMNAAYQRGHALGIDAILPPREAAVLDDAKAASIAAMHAAEAIRVRPHMLLCAVCQYGGGIRPPYPEDNLPELLQLILEAPETKLAMAEGAEWMMCAPCPYRAEGCGACVNNRGSGGLPNQMRDLRVLRALGLTYGAVLPAREVFHRIFTRISGTLEICRLDHAAPSVWFTGCGAADTDSADYARGKAELMRAWDF